MGRDAGYIALHSGIATGAENILIPERKTNPDDIIASLQEKKKRKKLVNLIIVAEGDEFGGANELSNYIRAQIPELETRVCILGHIQRGGSPSCLDRVIASRMGYHAVECLLNGTHNVMVGIEDNKMKYTPLDNAVKAKQKISDEWLKIVKILAS
jgi:6-phosphofructokinase 1